MIRPPLATFLRAFLAAVALLSLFSADASARQLSTGQVAPARRFSTLGSQYVQRIPNPPMLNHFALRPDVDGVIATFAIFVEATQSMEAFTIYAPELPAGQRAPLLTGFHAASVGWLGIQEFSGLIPEAIQRDWFLVAPWQRNTAASQNVSYGSEQSQLHVEAVLDFVLRRYAIDRDRIYGIGFSMGGGNALSYAARHRDRRHGAIAAVVNHTGTVALSDVYANVNGNVQTIMEQTFGGTPQAVPFEYQRSSLIELDSAGVLVSGGRHMARNLVSVPVQSWYHVADINGYLVNQTQAFDGFLSQLSGSQTQVFPVTTSTSNCVSLGQHCWDTVDRTMALDWLSNFTLDSSPAFGTVLTDRSVRWGQFEVEQAQPGAFSSFEFEVDPTGNSLLLSGPENLSGVTADISDLGLRADQPLSMRMRAAPGQSMVIRLTGWAAAPGSVERNATTRLPDCSGTGQGTRWCHDPASQSLLIVEDGMSQSSWVILP